ncbi:MAG: hypothetical protein ACR2OG_08445 [Gemmatimonadaceae bacterium]
MATIARPTRAVQPTATVDGPRVEMTGIMADMPVVFLTDGRVCVLRYDRRVPGDYRWEALPALPMEVA